MLARMDRRAERTEFEWDEDPQVQHIAGRFVQALDGRAVGGAVSLLVQVEGLLGMPSYPVVDACRRLGLTPRRPLSREVVRRACVQARQVLLLQPVALERLKDPQGLGKT